MHKLYKQRAFLRTINIPLLRIKRHILIHRKTHSATLGATDVEALLIHLAWDRNVATVAPTTRPIKTHTWTLLFQQPNHSRINTFSTLTAIYIHHRVQPPNPVTRFSYYSKSFVIFADSSFNQPGTRNGRDSWD